MKRFYKAVTAEAQDGGWRVLLDGRGIKTAAGSPQAVPSQALAEAMAEEWAAQGEELDTTRFPMRDLADYAIDVVMHERDELIAGMLPYGETDTMCYRADPDEPLHRRQLQIWEPVLARAEARYGVHFTRVSGIVHKPQPADTLARLRQVLEAKPPFALAALQMLASLAASLTIALLAQEPDEDVDALWDAASLEEEWQADLWGREAEAEERRAQRRASFALAARFAALSQRV
ncbi:chaperone required for assembly of F1-ATPase [Novosphingobium chloroacetimidivorans]|uniref:Chaperone required for assembly of F1-ATPase n=1 Tax=Novosphingobium chloroacetimidivorans TaxID=1428314 RepID=A0A7W7KCG0_9SPHN|nr:ATP12 family protein [Novosphingobium chloroacetimidivorans]MBB4860275.1 chaperone required for assembly of F1-ATPase [Novosphingobium chloroacetimidivorans]